MTTPEQVRWGDPPAALAKRYELQRRKEFFDGTPRYQGVHPASRLGVELFSLPRAAQRRVEALRLLSHDCWATVLDSEASGDWVWVVIERSAGENWEAMRQRGSLLTGLELQRATRGLLDALVQLRRRSAFHGAISTLAIRWVPTTMGNCAVLSLQPSAPEAYRPGAEVDAEARDVWGVAATLWAMASGRAPTGNWSPKAAFRSVALSEEMRGFFTATLHRDPAKRCTSIAAALAFFEAPRSKHAAPAADPPTAVDSGRPLSSAPAPLGRSIPAPPLKGGRRPAPTWPRWLAVGALLAGGAGIALWQLAPPGAVAPLRAALAARVHAVIAGDVVAERPMVGAGAASGGVVAVPSGAVLPGAAPSSAGGPALASTASSSSVAAPETIQLDSLPSGEELLTCVQASMPEGTWYRAPSVDWLCAETDPRQGATRLRSAVVWASTRYLTPLLNTWSRVRWYGMAAYASVRAGCCAGAAPLTLPRFDGCPDLARLSDGLGQAVVGGRGFEAELAAYRDAVHCQSRLGRQGSFEQLGPPGGGEEEAFRGLAAAVSAHGSSRGRRSAP